ncbi:unnamed protein product [Rotaria magnacalcarata]|uniref:Uncharacterized protein n=1 Tax=Rotaria magnacalcarata TaxID=392030 RepID=A0A820AD25_9BILA|nr:unnamed protein product [Rotaria magnacalcarata]
MIDNDHCFLGLALILRYGFRLIGALSITKWICFSKVLSSFHYIEMKIKNLCKRNANIDKICPLYSKSHLDNHSNHQITQLTRQENISTSNELIENLHNKGLAMQHAADEHMMVHNHINNDDQTNEIKQDELKMELDFIEQLLRKTKRQLYKRLQHLQTRRAISFPL